MCSPKGYGKVSEQKLAYLHMIKAIHPALPVGEEMQSGWKAWTVAGCWVLDSLAWVVDALPNYDMVFFYVHVIYVLFILSI